MFNKTEIKEINKNFEGIVAQSHKEIQNDCDQVSKIINELIMSGIDKNQADMLIEISGAIGRIDANNFYLKHQNKLIIEIFES